LSEAERIEAVKGETILCERCNKLLGTGDCARCNGIKLEREKGIYLSK